MEIINYRQIYILSVFPVIFECIVYNTIVIFLNRSDKSVEAATCQFLNYVYENFDKKYYVVSVI